MSIPAEIPAEVMILPSSTQRTLLLYLHSGKHGLKIVDIFPMSRGLFSIQQSRLREQESAGTD